MGCQCQKGRQTIICLMFPENHSVSNVIFQNPHLAEMVGREFDRLKRLINRTKGPKLTF